VLDVGECPYFLAVPDHGHVLGSRILDLCLFSDITDITAIYKLTIQLWSMCSLQMMSKNKSCMLDNTQLSSTTLMCKSIQC
jgi:hypothetical protein